MKEDGLEGWAHLKHAKTTVESMRNTFAEEFLVRNTLVMCVILIKSLLAGKQAVLVLSCDNTHMTEEVMVEPGLVMIFAHGIE